MPAGKPSAAVSQIVLDGYAGEISLTPDGRRAIVGDDAHAEIWDFTDRATPVRVGTLGDHTGQVGTAAISDDTKTALTATGDSAILWDLAEPSRPRYIAALPGKGAVIYAAVMNRDATVAATGLRDGELTVWDLASTRMLRTGDLRPVASGGAGITEDGEGDRSEGPDVTLSPDGRRAATILNVKGPLVLWDTSAPRAVKRLARLPEAAHRAQFSGDGTMLLTGAADGGGALLWVVRNARKPRRLASLPAKGDLTTSAMNIDRALAVTGSNEGVVTLWNIADRTSPRKLADIGELGDGVLAVSLSTDATKLLVADRYDTVTHWDVSEPAKPKKLAVLPGHTGSSLSVSYGPDARTAITTDGHGGAYQWDLDAVPSPAAELTARRIVQLNPDEQPALWQERIAGGQVAAFGGHGAAATLWLPTEQGLTWLTQVPIPGHSGWRTGWTQDGRTVAIVSHPVRNLTLWSLAALDDVMKDPLPRACALAGGGLTAQQWPAYAESLGHRATCPETVAPVTAPEQSLVGIWQAYGHRLEVRADLTGTRRWIEGPCFIPDGQACLGVASVSFTKSQRGLVGTMSPAVFQGEQDGKTVAGYEPNTITSRAGYEFVIHRADLDVIEVQNVQPKAGEYGFFLCGTLAPESWRKLCA
ncbi:WD40 repeat domain-containing protein [Actinoplanes auranticolor]|uniref:WD40 repeat domain-containing protein n=1 Tax=Actinoplanes auranticolor TaxID=47988 RepID=UPI001BB33980|nr:WD40 repeat domain-containing protein [Actinoplanes auranticolor]